MGKFIEVMKAVGIIAAHIAEQAAADPTIEAALVKVVAAAVAAHTTA
jgi:hypothetical protein